MVKKITALFFFLAFIKFVAFSQETNKSDSVAPLNLPEGLEIVEDTVAIHSPKKAALRSAIIPGWGQLYNRKYWKIPIVYAGLGTSIYFIVSNQLEYNYLKTAYLLRIDDDPNTQDLRYASEIPDQVIYDYMETYRGWLEWSVIATFAIYALNIIDATVDAHLFTFDVSDDLSLKISPGMLYTHQNIQPTIGLKFKF